MLLQQAETEYKEGNTTTKLKRNKDWSTKVRENQKELKVMSYCQYIGSANKNTVVLKRKHKQQNFCVSLFMRESLINIVLLGGDGNTSKKRRQQNSSGNGIQEKTTAKLKRNDDWSPRSETIM
jgi:hypothetical protein